MKMTLAMITERFTIVEEERGRTITLRGDEPGPEKRSSLPFLHSWYKCPKINRWVLSSFWKGEILCQIFGQEDISSSRSVITLPRLLPKFNIVKLMFVIYGWFVGHFWYWPMVNNEKAMDVLFNVLIVFKWPFWHWSFSGRS